MVEHRHPVAVMTMIDRLTSSGGGERVAMEITARLDGSRFRRLICATRSAGTAEEGEARRRLEAAGVEVIELKRRSRLDLVPWVRLARSLRASGIAILHSHKFGSNAWAAALARLAGVPVLIAHEHSWDFRPDSARALVDRHLIGRRAQAVVAVSEEDRRRMVEVERIPATKVRVIPNGIEDPGPAATREEARIALGLPQDAPVVGVVATMRPEKALEVALEASAIASKDMSDLRLVLAGGDSRGEPYLGQLRELAEGLGIADRVSFLGHREDVPKVIRAFDVALLCSDREGSPLSVIEYMSQERPVIATAVGGIPEIVVDGETGLLVPPRDPASLALSLHELLGNPRLARKMGAAGRERFLERYTIDHTTRAVEELYAELVASRAGAGSSRLR